ncbi:MAG: 4a-hydroxytetrahydrobiopterin dehydratase [Gloeobacterales cyanobacterium]
MSLLTETEIQEKLTEFPGWSCEKQELNKDFKLKDFVTALAFVIRVGRHAEELGHHPDILIHGYNNVKFSLSSHDAGGITDADFTLAKTIDQEFQA